MRPTVIVDQDIDWLLSHEKLVDDQHWRSRLLNLDRGSNPATAWLSLGDLPDGSPLGGTLAIYTRLNPNRELEDYSTGLVYEDYSGRSYTVIRCNGPHTTIHCNRIEGDGFIMKPHVHRLTERYQLHGRVKPDGFAEETDAYGDLQGALDHLVFLANLTPSGMLFL